VRVLSREASREERKRERKTERERERERKRDLVGSHFHGVAVTEIEMAASALLPPYGELTANISAPYMVAACAP